MKIAIMNLCCWVATTSAFTTMVQPQSRVTVHHPSLHTTTLASGKSEGEAQQQDEEEGGLDLDLGEMFDMFEAADKEQSFDDAIKKVKKGEN